MNMRVNKFGLGLLSLEGNTCYSVKNDREYKPFL